MPSSTDKKATRDQLITDLNTDLAREYQAIIAYVVYSQVLRAPRTCRSLRSLKCMPAKSCSTR